jgi:hypothetical protein
MEFNEEDKDALNKKIKVSELIKIFEKTSDNKNIEPFIEENGKSITSKFKQLLDYNNAKPPVNQKQEGTQHNVDDELASPATDNSIQHDNIIHIPNIPNNKNHPELPNDIINANPSETTQRKPSSSTKNRKKVNQPDNSENTNKENTKELQKNPNVNNNYIKSNSRAGYDLGEIPVIKTGYDDLENIPEIMNMNAFYRENNINVDKIVNAIFLLDDNNMCYIGVQEFDSLMNQGHDLVRNFATKIRIYAESFPVGKKQDEIYQIAGNLDALLLTKIKANKRHM